MRNLGRGLLCAVILAMLFALVTTIREPSPASAATCPAPRGGIQKGVDVLWHRTAVTSSSALRAHQLAAYARSINANSLSINFLISVNGPNGNTLWAGPNTPSIPSLRQIIAAAKSAGLRVSLRPLIDESNIPRPRWRGNISPTSPSGWFKSYGNLMVGYAQLAHATCVDELVVGTELSSMQRFTSQWGLVANRLRAAGYRGDLSYAANWNAPVKYSFARHSGVDFYPKYNLSSGASVTQVTNAMVGTLSRYSSWFRTGLVVQETGFPSFGGTYSNPSGWGNGSPSTLSQQSTWFTSVCRAAKRIRAAGVYYWVVDSSTNPYQPSYDVAGAFEFARHPAEAAVRSCFSTAW